MRTIYFVIMLDNCIERLDNDMHELGGALARRSHGGMEQHSGAQHDSVVDTMDSGRA